MLSFQCAQYPTSSLPIFCLNSYCSRVLTCKTPITSMQVVNKKFTSEDDVFIFYVMCFST